MTYQLNHGNLISTWTIPSLLLSQVNAGDETNKSPGSNSRKYTFYLSSLSWHTFLLVPSVVNLEKCHNFFFSRDNYLHSSLNLLMFFSNNKTTTYSHTQCCSMLFQWWFNSYSASHGNWCTATLWNRIMTAQCEGMGEVGSARYEPALLPPCPSIRVLSYSNCQRSTHSSRRAWQCKC